jgi:hypothetical protein
LLFIIIILTDAGIGSVLLHRASFTKYVRSDTTDGEFEDLQGRSVAGAKDDLS